MTPSLFLTTSLLAAVLPPASPSKINKCLVVKLFLLLLLFIYRFFLYSTSHVKSGKRRENVFSYLKPCPQSGNCSPCVLSIWLFAATGFRVLIYCPFVLDVSAIVVILNSWLLFVSPLCACHRYVSLAFFFKGVAAVYESAVSCFILGSKVNLWYCVLQLQQRYINCLLELIRFVGLMDRCFPDNHCLETHSHFLYKS